MAKKERVSITWQTVFMIFWPTAIYAFYRIEKLRRALLILLSIFVVGGFTGEYVLFPDEFWNDEDDISREHYAYNTALWIGEIGFSMVLVRKWSNEWNNRIPTGNKKDNVDDNNKGLFYTK